MARKSGKESGKWMQRAFSKHKGALHRELHVPEGEKIPEKKLEKAAHSKNPRMRRQAALAKVGRRVAGKRHRRHESRR